MAMLDCDGPSRSRLLASPMPPSDDDWFSQPPPPRDPGMEALAAAVLAAPETVYAAIDGARHPGIAAGHPKSISSIAFVGRAVDTHIYSEDLDDLFDGA
jgi:hypothetical protein